MYYSEEDPFDIYSSLLSITTGLYVTEETGESQIHGIFGMNFDINVFQKTIDPLIGNDYSDGLNYWVYLVK